MSVKIRLQRMGTKKKPYYRVVAVDSRKKRDGDVIEYLGQYHPISKSEQFNIKEEDILKWLDRGAIASETTEKLLRKAGIWKKFKDAKVSTGGTNGL